jgi:hypothetical protein
LRRLIWIKVATARKPKITQENEVESQ